MKISSADLMKTIGDAFRAGWAQGVSYVIEDAELHSSRMPIYPKPGKSCCKDYVDDVMYDLEGE